MAKTPAGSKGLLKQLNSQLKTLQGELVEANKVAGINDDILVKVKTNQGRFEKIKKISEPDKALGHFFIEINVTAKSEEVLIPLSVASGKKPAGFVYLIEGTAEGTIVSTDIKCRGDGVTQITSGTLLYVRILKGMTATLKIQITIRGKIGKIYKVVFTRINYKRAVSDVRYQQYIKPIISDRVKFS